MINGFVTHSAKTQNFLLMRMSLSVYKNTLVEIIHFSTNVLKLKDKWFYLLFKVTSESALRNLFFLRKGTFLMYLPRDRKVKEIAYFDKAFLQALVLIKTRDFRTSIDSVVLCDLTAPRRTINVLFFWVDIGEIEDDFNCPLALHNRNLFLEWVFHYGVNFASHCKGLFNTKKCELLWQLL